MTKAEMIKRLKDDARLNSLTQAEMVFESLFANITMTLKAGDTVNIAGFGSFKTVKREARKGRNPNTGQELIIPAATVVKFTPAKALKESL